ncbi:MAG: hypothetical protein JSS27_13630 [Planctomycetes bacterium]|nr:hypothetical protein [Planctomycetota bacterium]
MGSFLEQLKDQAIQINQQAKAKQIAEQQRRTADRAQAQATEEQRARADAATHRITNNVVERILGDVQKISHGHGDYGVAQPYHNTLTSDYNSAGQAQIDVAVTPTSDGKVSMQCWVRTASNPLHEVSGEVRWQSVVYTVDPAAIDEQVIGDWLEIQIQQCFNLYHEIASNSPRVLYNGQPVD